jgi:hypothetical protein
MMSIKIGSKFVAAPISCSLAQLAMASLLSTSRSTSAAPHIQLAYFGDDVGMGKFVPDRDTEPEGQCWFEMPERDTEPEDQCCFEIIEGPHKGQRKMFQRWQFSPGSFRLLLPHEVRSCELCAEKQCRALGYRPKFQQCSVCRCYYCSEECQHNDWTAHKLVCANRVHPGGQHAHSSH